MASGPTTSTAPNTSGIYAIRRDQRLYVGSAVNIRSRWSDHFSKLQSGKHENSYLQRAWDKYGEEAFEFIIIEECPVEQLLVREQHYIDLHPVRYNLCPAAGSPLGYKHTPEAKAKISAAGKGRKHTPETRAKISASNMGRVISPESRKRISASLTGHKAAPEAREKISTSLIGNQRAAGHVHTAEAREKMSAAGKGRKNTPEHNANISAASKGRVVSDETKSRISASQKARWDRQRSASSSAG